MGCKMPWWAGSETPPPDKDKMIADLRAEVDSLKEERDNLKLQYTNARHSQWSSEVNAIDEIHSLTQQLAAANGRVERLVAAATPVLRNELDKVEVHPCDYNDDTARARQCTAEVQELFAALSDLPEADKEKS